MSVRRKVDNTVIKFWHSRAGEILSGGGRTTAWLSGHEVAPVLAVDLLDGLGELAPGVLERPVELADPGLWRASWSSSSRILRTPTRLTPSLVSSWMRRSSAMSRSE